MTTKKNAPNLVTQAGAQEVLDAGSGGTTAMLPHRSPIAYCRAERARCSTGHYWVLIVDICPRCGRQHTHGAGNSLRPSYGHRPARCADGRLGGYWLEPAE